MKKEKYSFAAVAFLWQCDGLLSRRAQVLILSGEIYLFIGLKTKTSQGKGLVRLIFIHCPCSSNPSALGIVVLLYSTRQNFERLRVYLKIHLVPEFQSMSIANSQSTIIHSKGKRGKFNQVRLVYNISKPQTYYMSITLQNLQPTNHHPSQLREHRQHLVALIEDPSNT